jgi:hypothetical protein
VCVEETECFLIEGFELSPSYLARLQAVLEHTEVRGCFLGHGSFSVEDLVGYRDPAAAPRRLPWGAPRGCRLDPTAEQAAA